MPTQPILAGFWTVNIDAFESVETPSIPGDLTTIIDENENFELRLTLTGDGALWDALKATGLLNFRVAFSADIIGIGADVDLGDAVVTQNAANDTYTASLTTSIAAEGVYKCAAVVTWFIPVGGIEFPLNGFLGFEDNLLIQVNPQEA